MNLNVSSHFSQIFPCLSCTNMLNQLVLHRNKQGLSKVQPLNRLRTRKLCSLARQYLSSHNSSVNSCQSLLCHMVLIENSQLPSCSVSATYTIAVFMVRCIYSVHSGGVTTLSLLKYTKTKSIWNADSCKQLQEHLRIQTFNILLHISPN